MTDVMGLSRGSGRRRYNRAVKDRLPQQPVNDQANLIRHGCFSLDRLLSHVDPGTAEESENLVSRIYEQRHMDISTDQVGR